MKHWYHISIFIVAVFLSTATFGQDKKMTAINHLFEVMDMKNLTSKIIAATCEGMLKNYSNTDTLNASKKAKIDDLKAFIKQETDRFLDSYIDKDLAEIYRNHFTEREIKDITKFYESSTGKKMLAVSPDIQRESTPIMGQYMQTFLVKLQTKIQNMME